EKTVVSQQNTSGNSVKGTNPATDSKPPSCEFYNIEYCDPCKSPNDITKCDLFQIGTQIKIEKWNPSEQEECSHESHFISTKTECEKCKEKE
ncbi:hypothetical protein LCGC14_1774430, partial [marine sediment metagenome]